MAYNIRIVSTYPPRKCGIATFCRNLADALLNFPDELEQVSVAAIDNEHLEYGNPVDIVIDQYNPASWDLAIEKIIDRAAKSTNPTAVLLQHEYGLDCAEPDKLDGKSRFVKMASAFSNAGLITLVYLHTVLAEPSPNEKKIIQQLSRHSDALIVTTESAIDILQGPAYRIDPIKLKHIDHGIRMHHPSQYDRLAIKSSYGLEGRFLVTTVGLQSPGKGIPYGIRAYGEFISQSLTEHQRKKIIYLIAGQCHPEFIKAQGGKLYRQYQAELQSALEQYGLNWCKVEQLGGNDFDGYDVAFIDCFLDDQALISLYAATNVMVLPYLNMEQISSGILADTLGAGRVAVSTKFRYAVELINSNKKCPPGLVIGRHARGILVDPGPPSVTQIAQALDYLVFNKEKRLRMEKQAHQRGYQMRWDNVTWALLQYIDFINEEHQIVTGRGITFTREKPSPLQMKFGTSAG